MSVKSRLKDARKWLKHARKRVWGAKKVREEKKEDIKDVRKHLKKADKPRPDLVKEREQLAKDIEEATKKVKDRQKVKERLEKKVRFLEKKADQHEPPTSGVGTFDGKPIAAWMIPILSQARKSGRWHGTLTSGYRSPAYSQQLCYGICGRPTCPGTCAGTTSNHTKCDKPYGAVDVSDPSGFASAMALQGRPLYNALGSADPWHFSSTGR